MDSFPPELLHNTFTQLDLHERLVCMLVCRRWWFVLDKCSLPYSNIISKGSDQFDRLIEMLKRSPHHAAQVEELTICGGFNVNINKRVLCNTFPNLRYVELKYPKSNHYSSESIEVTQTTSKIQHVSDSVYYEYASQMMNSNLCSHLSTLELNFE